MQREEEGEKAGSGLSGRRSYGTRLGLFFIDMIFAIVVMLFVSGERLNFQDTDDSKILFIPVEIEDSEKIQIGQRIINKILNNPGWNYSDMKIFLRSGSIYELNDFYIEHSLDSLICSLSTQCNKYIQNGAQYYVNVRMIQEMYDCFSRPVDGSGIPDSCHEKLHLLYKAKNLTSDGDREQYLQLKNWFVSATNETPKYQDLIKVGAVAKDTIKFINFFKDRIESDNFSTKNQIDSIVSELNSIENLSSSELYKKISFSSGQFITILLIFALIRSGPMRSVESLREVHGVINKISAFFGI